MEPAAIRDQRVQTAEPVLLQKQAELGKMGAAAVSRLKQVKGERLLVAKPMPERWKGALDLVGVRIDDHRSAVSMDPVNRESRPPKGKMTQIAAPQKRYRAET